MTDLLNQLFRSPVLTWDGVIHITGGTMSDTNNPDITDETTITDEVEVTLRPEEITGYLVVPLPGRQSAHTTLVWTKPWPPPRLLAVVVTQSGRFPSKVLALDATDWIDGTTVIPGADIAHFYVMSSLQSVQDMLAEPEARYNRILGVTVGSPT